jgi:electron transfer flavoprotein beta subunit
MNIAVCIRQVPSTETRITVSPLTNQVDLKSVDWVISPYDEYALEEALRIREKQGGTVTAVTLSPERARSALKTALATGADAAQFITDPALDNADSYVTARVLAQALRRSAYDLILCGNKGVDDDMGYVAIALAEFLGLPHVTSVTNLEFGGRDQSPDTQHPVTVRVHREIEGATEIVETSLPAVLTAQKGLNEPRYPTLRGMMLAGKKEIPTVKLADLFQASESIPVRTGVLRATLPPERKSGRVIDGTPPEAARELVRTLREEAKVI